MEHLFWLGIGGAVLALAFAFAQSRKVLKLPEGNARMVEIAASIREGADAYLKRQYRTVFKFFAIVFVALLALALIPPLAGGAISQLMFGRALKCLESIAAADQRKIRRGFHLLPNPISVGKNIIEGLN